MVFGFGDGRDWFPAARFGMFVHWGLYALDGWHEQQHYRQGLGRDEYRRLATRFNPSSFDPDSWLDLAEACGMAYLVVTAKHIDGFCMFRTAASDFSLAQTPYSQDIIGMVANACHKRGFPFGVYFSALDNLHPSYPRAGRAHESPAESGDRPDYETYIQSVRAQVRELCTQYGEIRVFWWDANRTGMTDPSINAMIRSLQPTCVINDRGWDEGDFGTPERCYDVGADCAEPFQRLTEACESVGSQSWGFRHDEDYFTPRYLMERIDLMMSKGANYLLNVGPDAAGTIPPPQERILRRLGAWYRKVAEAFDGTRPAHDLVHNRTILLSRRETTLYIHLNRTPSTAAVILNPINVLPSKATLLNTGEAVPCDINRLPSLHHEKVVTALRVHGLPVERLAGEVPIVKLEFSDSAFGLNASQAEHDNAPAAR